MPKIKTKSSAKKRFKVLASGKIKRGFAFRRHLLTKKTTKRKRMLRKITFVNKKDANSIHKMLPYA